MDVAAERAPPACANTRSTTGTQSAQPTLDPLVWMNPDPPPDRTDPITGAPLAYGIGDTQCGFQFFQGAVATDLFTRQRIDGYMFDVEILYLARRLGYRIKEVGVRWQADGDSRSDALTQSVGHGMDLLRIRFGPKPGAPGPADTPLGEPEGPAAIQH